MEGRNQHFHTLKQRNLATLILEGYGPQEIAKKLRMTIPAIRKSIWRLCREFGARNRTDLAVLIALSMIAQNTKTDGGGVSGLARSH